MDSGNRLCFLVFDTESMEDILPKSRSYFINSVKAMIDRVLIKFVTANTIQSQLQGICNAMFE